MGIGNYIKRGERFALSEVGLQSQKRDVVRQIFFKAKACFGILAFLSILLIPSMAKAGAVYWTNFLGGLYSDTSNWSPNGTPLSGDFVIFTNANTYSLTVDVAATNSSAFFNAGNLTQNTSSNSWLLTNEWRVGEAAGNTSQVMAVSGQLNVTNGAGTGVISVGRVGTGALTIAGANVTGDFLQASNGSKTILNFANGSLTTLHGSVINSSTAKLVLGTTAGNAFVWNIFGGTNQILNTGNNPYGGLTLANSSNDGRAIINLNGPGTTLNVAGLDTYGRNEIHITSGAKFHTESVQLGFIAGGTNNTVVISDPGSSWINDYLIYFGMHFGAQTMVITNGGYFQTGGTNYLDQELTTFENPNNKIIITGSNSWFSSVGTAEFGLSWSSPVTSLNNLLLVTNGGRFWAKQLTYGSTNINIGSVSRPGNTIDIADGSMWIGSLVFAVGTLQIEAGNGTIDQLSMVGGTNALIQTAGNFYVGHHGSLGSGELRVGGATMNIGSFNGQLQSGGWQMGVFAGDSGNLTMTGGRALITNISQTASLIIGRAGSGMFRVDNGSVQADIASVGALTGSSGSLILNGPASSFSALNLIVGPGGTVVVSNMAALQISNCVAPTSAISAIGATLEFAGGNPVVPGNAIRATNVTFSFRNTGVADLDLSNPNYLGRIQRSGRTVLQLIQTTNDPLTSLLFRDNDPSNWSRLILNGGTSMLQAGSIMIETNSSLAATNTTTTISGSFTNCGQLILNNSTLRFVGPATLSYTSSFQGSRGVLLFTGGLHLPATDVVVPAGIGVQASSITSDGGKLVIQGGEIIPNDDDTVASDLINFQNGWVTFFDTSAASMVPPAGLVGSLGVELIRSTNAPVNAQIFAAGGAGYERLRLGSGSGWRSQQLVISRGGSMYMADSTATVILASGIFRVEQGGLFENDTSGASYVGFSPASSNASAVISGNGSTWLALNAISIGANGSQNQLLVESGGKLFASSGTIGGSTGNSNRLTIDGLGASCFATNGLLVAGNRNQLVIQNRGTFFGSQITASGSSSLVSLEGAGTLVNCSTQVVLSGTSSELAIMGGAHLYTSNGVLNAMFGSTVKVSGEDSLWNLTGSLSINAPVFQTNSVIISSNASIVCSALSLNNASFNRPVLMIQSGQLYVTNTAGTASMTVNGLFDMYRGLLHADKINASNAAFSSINIRAGKAEWANCDLAAGIPFAIGDGTNLAILNLLGGTNICRSGLEIRRYSRLTGDGTVVGTVTNRGAFWPSSLIIKSNLVFDSTSEMAFSITGAPNVSQNSSLSVAGNISLAGNLAISINPGVILSNSQNFVLIQYGSISAAFSNVIFGQRLLTRNRLASFRIDDTGTQIVAGDFRSEDLDGDGIQDAWATQHFGISPLLSGTGKSDLDGDWDGDGLSNRDEFLLGTDPNDPTSGLFIQIERTRQNAVNVHFPYLSNRTYQMRISDNLMNWTNMVIGDFSFDNNGLAVWSDISASSTNGRFFRLLIQ